MKELVAYAVSHYLSELNEVMQTTFEQFYMLRNAGPIQSVTQAFIRLYQIVQLCIFQNTVNVVQYHIQ